ncbi:hypothetical protein SAMN04488541_102836 [Thermoflexibacter ruber]|uniref:Uncharacterized protein n=2 Tax=Thermoflexibacter ruber TaxID=1003 RepID=A0A1I2I3N1_9BACT|nr:hypothetical protein SAMN04488541_102836 [Thermoflexibacter ruber]
MQDMESDFEKYLIGKNINPQLFKEKEPARFKEFEQLFAQMHPKSFTAQKLYLINKIRRMYQLKK